MLYSVQYIDYIQILEMIKTFFSLSEVKNAYFIMKYTAFLTSQDEINGIFITKILFYFYYIQF